MHKPFQLGNSIISLIGIRYIQKNIPTTVYPSRTYHITIAYKGDKVVEYFDDEQSRDYNFNQLQKALIQGKQKDDPR